MYSAAPRRCMEKLSKVETSPPEKYQIVEKIAQGGYGIVLKAFIKNNQDAGFFALKTNRHPGHEGKVTTIDYNEVKILLILKKEKHVAKLIELVRDTKQFSLVLEYCIVDLKKILYYERIPVTVSETKNILFQLFRGIRALHGYKIMHRDLKPSNILLSSDGIVKIADFGLALQIGPKLPKRLSTNIGTIWYKSPELILGHGYHDQAVDLWSAGCMATEFYMREPALFRGNDDISQMEKISQLCGFCSEAVWPEAKDFPNYKNMHAAFAKYTEVKLHKHLMQVTHHLGAANFLSRLLKLNAGQRMTAEQALKDVYFESAPSPSRDLHQLLKALHQLPEETAKTQRRTTDDRRASTQVCCVL